MHYGRLQRWILRDCWQEVSGKNLGRRVFLRYYQGKPELKVRNQEGILTRCLEGLIDDGLLVGYGVRTPHKWFIREVRLTAKGRRIIRQLLDRRQKLPLKS